MAPLNDSDRTDRLRPDAANLIPALVQHARDARIVTPVSSLIVLETEADYQRTGITKGSSKLGQAGLLLEDDAGAAPEPGEWALLILCLIAIAFLYRRRLPFAGRYLSGVGPA